MDPSSFTTSAIGTLDSSKQDDGDDGERVAGVALTITGCSSSGPDCSGMGRCNALFSAASKSGRCFPTGEAGILLAVANTGVWLSIAGGKCSMYSKHR